MHTDETYFRDTAHGFLASAVATLFTAALLTSTISSIVDGGVHAVASMTTGLVAPGVTAAGAVASRTDTTSVIDGVSGVLSYSVDSLFRKGSRSTVDSTTAATTSTGSELSTVNTGAEISRILAKNIGMGTLTAADTAYGA